MSVMKAFISVVGLALLAFVVVGFILPSEWSTERTRSIDAHPDSVFAYLQDLERWSGWSTLGQVEGTVSDPSSGQGATLSWDDEIWGDGVLSLTRVTRTREVDYAVAVQGGSIQTRGRMQVTGDGDGAVITWEESGDMGWNPLLSYFALGMERMQGDEIDKALDRLEALAEGREPPVFGPA